MLNHLITLMVFLPTIGALWQAFLPDATTSIGKPSQLPRWIALASSLAAGFCGLALVVSMQRPMPELQASDILPWIGSYAISYDMGMDGLNAMLVLLISILFPVLIASEWNRKSGTRGVHGLYLVLQTALFGTVCAQDLFLQFFFWGLSALPFYFLIGIWGGEKREEAAFRYLVVSVVGNALLFAALILVYYSVDPHSFSLRELAGGKFVGKSFELLGHDLPVSSIAFAMISLGLALRAPIWPLHGWFTAVAEEAPPSVFVALSAAVVPTATYVFVRLGYSLFPEVMNSWSQIIVVVGGVNLVLGGICAVAQPGLKLLLAFICLSEVGFTLVGIGSLNSAGVVGAVYQQLALGLGLAGFGLCTGILTERSGHSVFQGDVPNKMHAFGGIAARAPAVAVVSGIVIASLLGFPGSGGFVGHALLIIGSFAIHPLVVILAGLGLMLATYYLFTMYRCVFFGKSASGSDFWDLTIRERAYLFPLVAGILFCGLYPKPMLELVRPTVLSLLSTVK